MKHSSRERKTHHHGKTFDSAGVDPASASGFNFGYFYRSIEDHIVAYAAQAGGENTFSDIAAELSRLLEAASVRERMGGSELVPQMRQDLQTNRRGRPSRLLADDLGAAEDIHVRPRNRRTLSVRARKRIAQAQHERWAKTRREAARVKGSPEYEAKRAAKREADRERWRKSYYKRRKPGTGSYWTKMTRAERSAEVLRRLELGAKKRAENGAKKRAENGVSKSKHERYSRAARGYWAKMTPAERSAEVLRRQQVAEQKKKAS